MQRQTLSQLDTRTHCVPAYSFTKPPKSVYDHLHFVGFCSASGTIFCSFSPIQSILFFFVPSPFFRSPNFSFHGTDGAGRACCWFCSGNSVLLSAAQGGFMKCSCFRFCIIIIFNDFCQICKDHRTIAIDERYEVVFPDN